MKLYSIKSIYGRLVYINPDHIWFVSDHHTKADTLSISFSDEIDINVSKTEWRRFEINHPELFKDEDEELPA